MKVWSWRQAIEESDLKPTTKLVLYTLSNYMNAHGEGCYPSIDRIAHACGLVKRVIYRHLNEAEENGFLIRSKRKVEGQKWLANEYKASFPQWVTLESPGDSTVTQQVTLESLNGCLQSHPNSPMNSPIDIIKKNTKKREIQNFDDFEEFWELYNYKVGKQQSIRSYYNSIKGGAKHETIIEGVKRYQEYIRANNTNKKFIKHPSTWLNNKCWNDQYPTIETANSKQQEYKEAAVRGMLRAENPDF